MPWTDHQPRPLLLLADEQGNVLRTLRMVLEREGFTVITAYNAEEACNLLRQGLPIRAVLTELHLESIDSGVEARAALRLPKPPIVIVCSYLMRDEDASLCHSLGVAHVMNKPVPVAELRRALQPAQGESASLMEAA